MMRDKLDRKKEVFSSTTRLEDVLPDDAGTNILGVVVREWQQLEAIVQYTPSGQALIRHSEGAFI